MLTCEELFLLLTKDSGGRYTEAKLDAARTLGVPVVVVARPSRAPGVAEAADAAAAATWVESLGSLRP